MTIRATLTIGALATVLLSGCAASDDVSGRFLVQPEKYQLYNCGQLADAAEQVIKRRRELEGLMAKAGTDASGRFVGTVAYRPEYLQLRGQMNEIRRTSIERKCKFDPETPPGASGSDEVIR